MADKRIKAPRTMSQSELADHMRRFHGSDKKSVESHTLAHHLTKVNHSHKSARLSEPTHPDWLRKVW